MAYGGGHRRHGRGLARRCAGSPSGLGHLAVLLVRPPPRRSSSGLQVASRTDTCPLGPRPAWSGARRRLLAGVERVRRSSACVALDMRQPSRREDSPGGGEIWSVALVAVLPSAGALIELAQAAARRKERGHLCPAAGHGGALTRRSPPPRLWPRAAEPLLAAEQGAPEEAAGEELAPATGLGGGEEVPPERSSRRRPGMELGKKQRWPWRSGARARCCPVSHARGWGRNRERTKRYVRNQWQMGKFFTLKASESRI